MTMRLTVAGGPSQAGEELNGLTPSDGALYGNRIERFSYILHRLESTASWSERHWVAHPELPIHVSDVVLSYKRRDRIKGTAKMKVLDEVLADGNRINFLSDVIECRWHFREAKPGSTEYGFAMGTYYLSSPDLPLLKGVNSQVRDIQAHDATVLLDQWKILDYVTAPKNAEVLTFVITIIGQAFPQAGIDIPNPLPKPVFGEDKHWDPGTPLLDVVNACLAYVNYTSLRANVTGSLVSQPYSKPSDRKTLDAPLFEYSDTAPKQLFIGDESILRYDVFGAPNAWLRTVGRPDDPTFLTSTPYKLPNSNPLSAAKRGRVILDYAAVDVVDQAALDTLTINEAEDSQTRIKQLIFKTPLLPSDWADMANITYSRLPVDDQSLAWVESEWTMPFKAGGPMEHTFECVTGTAVTF